MGEWWQWFLIGLGVFVAITWFLVFIFMATAQAARRRRLPTQRRSNWKSDRFEYD